MQRVEACICCHVATVPELVRSRIWREKNVLKESADMNQSNSFAKGGEGDVLTLKFNDNR